VAALRQSLTQEAATVKVGAPCTPTHTISKGELLPNLQEALKVRQRSHSALMPHPQHYVVVASARWVRSAYLGSAFRERHDSQRTDTRTCTQWHMLRLSGSAVLTVAYTVPRCRCCRCCRCRCCRCQQVHICTSPAGHGYLGYRPHPAL
jgi:hypothetical protein